MGIVNQTLFMARQCQIIQYETISFHLGFKFCLKSNFFHKSCVFKKMLTYFLFKSTATGFRCAKRQFLVYITRSTLTFTSFTICFSFTINRKWVNGIMLIASQWSFLERSGKKLRLGKADKSCIIMNKKMYLGTTYFVDGFRL